jgi:hypothetical protein
MALNHQDRVAGLRCGHAHPQAQQHAHALKTCLFVHGSTPDMCLQVSHTPACMGLNRNKARAAKAALAFSAQAGRHTKAGLWISWLGFL